MTIGDLSTRAASTARRAVSLRQVHRPRRSRMPRQQWPKSIELAYAQALVKALEPAREALREHGRELLELIAAARGERKADRMDAGEGGRIRRLMQRVRQRVDSVFDSQKIDDLARLFGERTQSYQRVQLGRQVRAALGADVVASDHRIGKLLDDFAHENAVLIRSVPHDVVDEVERLVLRGVTGAQPVGELAGDIDERFDVGESRARLIARDQVGKLYGQTNAYRQQDLGIEAFVWRTAGDERVRPEHEQLDGQTFRYDDLPAEGLPGEPIQCRCYAEPVIGEIAGAVRDLEG